jgi:hypothetical protein
MLIVVCCEGDLLRATTCWSPGFADMGAGVAADIGKFAGTIARHNVLRMLRRVTCPPRLFTIAAAGNVKWRKGVFDCTGKTRATLLPYPLLIMLSTLVVGIAGAPWQDTLDALLSNTLERSDSITLVFERQLP